MKIKGEMIFSYKDTKSAELAYDSLEVDNENYLDSKLIKNQIKYTINNENIGSFLRTADDLIASEIVVEKIIKNTNLKQ